ncbi:hypothetical protein [Serratia marcescens]|uniref:hypothetical protein n=1 Tax=Serratia TaxID=613 RepID=UPI003BA13366
MKKNLFIFSCLVIGFAATATYHIYYHKPVIELRCSGEYTARKMTEDGRNSELKIKITTFIKKNGYGISVLQGELSADDKTYIVDREINISYKKLDKKDVHAVTRLKTNKRNDDSLPTSLSKRFAILGEVSNISYVSITSINGQAYLFNELSMPYFLCDKF